MIFKFKKKHSNLYNTLLSLSRNIFFYKEIKLNDSFETRIYLMFFHFSIMMLISKQKGKKFDQDEYDLFFNNIENNLRELGFGDISVNKKMKDLNKILYDILLKFNIETYNSFKINEKVVFKYFNEFNDNKSKKYEDFESYFVKYYKFCFDQPYENMIKAAIEFK